MKGNESGCTTQHDHALLEETVPPGLHVVQGGLVCDVVHQEAAIGASVEGRAQ